MNKLFCVIAALLFCNTAHAQVTFQPVDGNTTNLTPIIEAWKALIGTSFWGWGATATDLPVEGKPQGDGFSDIVLSNHNAAPPGVPPIIVLRNTFNPTTGFPSFTDVTSTVFPIPANYEQLTQDNKPHVGMWDELIGYPGTYDLLTGTGGSKTQTQVMSPLGIFAGNGNSFSGRERSSVLGDFNNDSRMDIKKVEKLYSRSTVMTNLNGPNAVFTTTPSILFSDDLPRPATIRSWTSQDADTCRLTMGQDYGLAIGMVVNLTWGAYSRTGMTVTLITPNITVDGGTGENLPIANTAVTVTPQPDAFYLALPAVVRDRWIQSVQANNFSNGYNRTKGPEYLERDLNNDGRVDLLMWFEGSYLGDCWQYLCRRQPDGSLLEVTLGSGIPIEGCLPLSVKDVNKDGLMDLLIAPRTLPSAAALLAAGLYIQDANGNFSKAANPSIASKLAQGASYVPHEWWEDFDKDSNDDLAVSLLRTGRGYVWKNDGNGVFTLIFEATHWDADGMQVRSRWGYPCDFNGDGKTDVLTIGSAQPSSSSPAICWLNTSAVTIPPIPPETPQIELDAAVAKARHANASATIVAQIDILVETENRTPQQDAELQLLIDKLNASSDVLEGSGMPEPPTEPQMSLLPPHHDVNSVAYGRYKTLADQDLVGSKYQVAGWDHALIYKIGLDAGVADERHRLEAIKDTDELVAKAEVEIAAGLQYGIPSCFGGNYLYGGPVLKGIAATYAWCNPSSEQKARWKKFADAGVFAIWNVEHYDDPRGDRYDKDESVGYWGGVRYVWPGFARADPGNNHFHSRLKGSIYWAIASGNKEMFKKLEEGGVALLQTYFAETGCAGSREGNGYGESFRYVFDLARVWKDSTGNNILGDMPKRAILYWVHSTTPNFAETVFIGDHARQKGILDGYHRDLVRAAMWLAEYDSPEAAIGRWWLNRAPQINSQSFMLGYELYDITGTETQPSSLIFYDPGTGHLFVRTGWDANATLLSVVCGPFDESHAFQEQGSFSIWKNGWQTCPAARWSHSGILQDTRFQSIVRFTKDAKDIMQWRGPGFGGIMNHTDSPTQFTATMQMDACYTKPVSGVKWTRKFTWNKPGKFLVEDTVFLPAGVTAASQLQTKFVDGLQPDKPGTWLDWQATLGLSVFPLPAKKWEAPITSQLTYELSL